ncbi:hypothetical protein N8157_03260 [Burkholderiales bacterium]|nr:hypothetical protein [Burkholderiales bacterium]
MKSVIAITSLCVFLVGCDSQDKFAQNPIPQGESQVSDESAQSFNPDCSQMNTWSEKTICEDERLNELHEGVSTFFRILDKSAESDESRASELSTSRSAWYENLEECSTKSADWSCLAEKLSEQLSASFSMLDSENVELNCSIPPLSFKVVIDELSSFVLVENDWYGSHQFIKDITYHSIGSGRCAVRNFVFDFNGLVYGVKRSGCVSQHHPDGVIGDITIGTTFNKEYKNFEDGTQYWCFFEE